MENFTIILDINGVLGEVSSFSKPRRSDGVRLLNRQIFYPFPGIPQFLKDLRAIDNVSDIVVWTSRKASNAQEIEKFLDHGCEARRSIVAYYHGEDCRSHVGCFNVKETSVFREIHPASANDFIIWVDDNPERVMLDDRSAVLCPEPGENLKDLAHKISVCTIR